MMCVMLIFRCLQTAIIGRIFFTEGWATSLNLKAQKSFCRTSKDRIGSLEAKNTEIIYRLYYILFDSIKPWYFPNYYILSLNIRLLNL